MTIAVREWLPQDAFTAEAVRPALAVLVTEWAERWFARPAAEISAVHTSEARPRLAQSLPVKGSFTEAELSGRGKRTLLEAALVTDLCGLTLTERDHRVLDAFAVDAMKDLLAALDALGNGASAEADLSVTLCLDGKEIAIVLLPAHFLIPAIKAATGTARLAGAAPRSRVEALKPVRLAAEGILGSAELTLEDVRGLAVGDVVVLDSLLDGPVELHLPASGRRIGRGRLVRSSDGFFIHF